MKLASYHLGHANLKYEVISQYLISICKVSPILVVMVTSRDKTC